MKFDLNWPAEILMLNEFYKNIIDRFYVFNKLLLMDLNLFSSNYLHVQSVYGVLILLLMYNFVYTGHTEMAFFLHVRTFCDNLTGTDV